MEPLSDLHVILRVSYPLHQWDRYLIYQRINLVVSIR